MKDDTLEIQDGLEWNVGIAQVLMEEKMTRRRKGGGMRKVIGRTGAIAGTKQVTRLPRSAGRCRSGSGEAVLFSLGGKSRRVVKAGA
jgi:hypothetical protein